MRDQQDASRRRGGGGGGGGVLRQKTLFGGTATEGRWEKKKKKKKTKEEKDAKETKERCPICGAMQPATRVEEHANACLDMEEERERKKMSSERKKETSGTESHSTRKRTMNDDDDDDDNASIPNGGDAAYSEDKKSINAFDKIKRGSIEMSKKSSPSFIYGHKIIENFIAREEEEELLRTIYDPTEQTWNDRNANGNGHHNGKSWGVNADRARRKVFKAKRKIPEAFQRIVLEKLRTIDYGYKGLREFGFACNECNAIEYLRDRGHELRPHVDDRILSSDIIVNLSMVGSCVMRYRMNKNQGIEIAKNLPRFSLQIQGGKCRFEWEHGIRNEDLIDGKRVSLTFRCSGRGNGKDGVYKDVEFDDAPSGYVNDLEGRDVPR